MQDDGTVKVGRDSSVAEIDEFGFGLGAIDLDVGEREVEFVPFGFGGFVAGIEGRCLRWESESEATHVFAVEGREGGWVLLRKFLRVE